MIKTILSVVLICSFHLLLIWFKLLPGNFNSLLYLDLFLAAVFVIGLLVMFPGIKKDPENFVGRFLIMTVFQLLISLTYLIIQIVQKKTGYFNISLNGVALFVILLVIQSVNLVREIRQKRP